MRPIDADELKKDLGEVLMNLMKSHETSRIEKVGFALDVVDEAETLDVAPVVHGRWEVVEFIDPHGFMVERHRRCSVCHEFVKAKKRNFCPNCGAKMDGEKDA